MVKINILSDDGFQWSRPPNMNNANLSASARLAHAIALENQARQRELLLRLVCKQLRKANEERFNLLRELEGYRGSARDALYQENRALRERIDRVTKENLTLWAMIKTEKIKSVKKKYNKGR